MSLAASSSATAANTYTPTPRCCGTTSWLSLDSRATQPVSPATCIKHLVLMYSCSIRSLTPSLCYIHSSLSTPQSEQLPSVDHLSTIDTVYSRTDGLSIAQAHLNKTPTKIITRNPTVMGGSRRPCVRWQSLHIGLCILYYYLANKRRCRSMHARYRRRLKKRLAAGLRPDKIKSSRTPCRSEKNRPTCPISLR